MLQRARLVPVLLGLLALAGALAIRSSAAATPTLTMNVSLDGSLEVVLGNGTRIHTSTAPGAVIPPGPYLAVVASDVPDSRDVYHMFHLSGSGVNVVSDLLPCENPRPLVTVKLLPGTTYTYQDDRHPELAPVVFTTSSGGSSSDTSAVTAGSSSTAKYSGSSSNTSVIGAGVGALAYRGMLVGTVGPTGSLTLSRNGKSVTSLRSGRYRIAVDDNTPKVGFALALTSSRPIQVTGPSFVGKHTVTLDLKPGRWMFYSSAARRHHFTVVS